MDNISKFYTSSMYGRSEVYKRITYRQYGTTYCVQTRRVYFVCAVSYLKKNDAVILAVTDCEFSLDRKTFFPDTGIVGY